MSSSSQAPIEPSLRPTLARLAAGQDLSSDEMSGAVEAIFAGGPSEDEIAELLTALRTKGETVAEVAGAATAMRRRMTPIRTSRAGVIDTCGTGGDGSGTFNISTAAALVTAAAGVPVAKHGNRAMSSRTGSADVLAMLGVNIQAEVATIERCLDELGICFCFAPLLHPSMARVSAVRKRLGVPTIFNLLGPLTNPAQAPFQLLGVGRSPLRPLLSAALAQLGVQRALVVRGDDGLDELTLAGTTRVTKIEHGQSSELTWTPADFGLPGGSLEALLVDGPRQSADMILNILIGTPGAPRDIVVLNAAAALWTAGHDGDPITCAARAAEAIDSGAARELLAKLVALSNESAKSSI